MNSKATDPRTLITSTTSPPLCRVMQSPVGGHPTRAQVPDTFTQSSGRTQGRESWGHLRVLPAATGLPQAPPPARVLVWGQCRDTSAAAKDSYLVKEIPSIRPSTGIGGTLE